MKGMPNPTIDWRTMGPREVVFSWDDPNDNKQYHFAVERLEKYLESVDFEINLVQLDHELAKDFPTLKGLEPYRLVRLLQDPTKWTPIIICMLPDGDGLTVDGNHRYYLAHLAGLDVIPAYLVPMKIWNQYLVKFPYKLNNLTSGWSGIL